MSTLVTDTVQLGSEVDSTKNLVIRTNKDGTFTIARGNAGATTQDIILVDAQGNLIPRQPGAVIQQVVHADAGSVFSSTTMANRSATFASITPRSTSSNISVQVTFYVYAGVNSGGSNFMNLRIYEDNTTPLGVTVSSGLSSSGAGSQLYNLCTMSLVLDNTALTERNFSLWASHQLAPTSNGAINQCVWTLTEIAK